MTELDTQQKKFDATMSIEDDVIKYTAVDMVNEKEVSHLLDIGQKALGRKIVSLVLVDINNTLSFSLGVRGHWIRFLKDPHIKKTAVFGGDRFAKTVASFIITASGSDSTSLFNTEEEALKWLQS